MKMKLKVCGLKYMENMEQVISLDPDFIGFIFYEKSPRYMGIELQAAKIKALTIRGKKVGVFVNEKVAKVSEVATTYGLDFVQLHGHESWEDCRELKNQGHGVIKVFHIDSTIVWNDVKDYISFVDYFLFDTKSEAYGGTGKVFNWEVLESYPFDTPYFLSGGIDIENIEDLHHLKGKHPYAVDVNSRFEVKPGLKDIALLQRLKEKLPQINEMK